MDETKLAPEIVQEADESAGVVRVLGEVDIYSVGSLAEALEVTCNKGGNVIVDLTLCRYIDSSVLDALLRAKKNTKGKMRLVAGEHTIVRRVIALTHIDQLIPVFSTIEDARNSIPD